MSSTIENSTPSQIEAQSATTSVRVKVWDFPVRLFHWSLALSFIGAYVTNRLGVAYFKYHEWFGYAIIVLVVFRILWGFFGTYHARFVVFLRSPIATWRYAKDFALGRVASIPGHNPLGALMVVLLLLTLLVQAATGLFANDEIFNAGALYGYVSNELSLSLTALHKDLFYWIAGAVAVHILAVLLHLVLKRENLVSAMFTGYKRFPKNSAVPAEQLVEIKSSRSWLALVLVTLVALALIAILLTAPEASLSFDY